MAQEWVVELDDYVRPVRPSLLAKLRKRYADFRAALAEDSKDWEDEA